jgi:hypothetical protein
MPPLDADPDDEELAEGQLRIKRWMDQQKELMKEDWDLPVVVTGNERKGKSSIAFMMALYLDPDFDPVEQIVFSADDFTRKATKLGKYRVLILDEAVSGGFSRDAGSGPNKRLAKFLTVCGDRNLVMFVLWPNIRWLDPILKEHRIRFNVHVERRLKKKAIAKFRLLRDDDETVYDYPVTLWRFTFPKARGPKWMAYKKAKSAFVDQVGRGRDDEVETQRGDAFESMKAKLRPILKQLVAAGADAEE